MDIRFVTLAFVVCSPLCLSAQQTEPVIGEEPAEEVVITGQRNLYQLRLQMIDAEKRAYDLFNAFNDEKRFEIGCSTYQPINTRLESQICIPEFERKARATHAQDAFKNVQDMLDQYGRGVSTPVENYPPNHVSAEAVIAGQQKAYRAKMRQVAQEHPEFLEALKQYSDLKNQYEQGDSQENKD